MTFLGQANDIERRVSEENGRGRMRERHGESEKKMKSRETRTIGKGGAKC